MAAYDRIFTKIGEWDSLCKIAQDSGCEAKLDLNDSDYPFQVKPPGFAEMTRGSGQLLARIAMEFVSSEWAVLSAIEVLKRGKELLGAEHAEAPA